MYRKRFPKAYHISIEGKVGNMYFFFISFREAVWEKNIARLKGMIYLVPGKGLEVQLRLIRHLLFEGISQQRRDAFSLQALDLLIQYHLDKFIPCAPDVYQELTRDKVFGNTFQLFGQEHFFVFDHPRIEIVIVETAAGLRLLYWAWMNELLKGVQL